MSSLRLPIIVLACLGLLGVSFAQRAPASAAAAKGKPGKSNYPQVMEIFSGHCGTSKCHGGLTPKHKMELVTYQGLHDTVVDIAAEEVPGMKRVLPGQPEESYLFLKITKHRRPDDTRIKWKAMPYEAAPPYGEKRLSDAQIAVIEQWIKQGAPLE